MRNFDSDSEEEDQRNKHDIHNYKGICDEDEEEKFIDPDTGAHFEFKDFCKRLTEFRNQNIDLRYQRNHNSQYYSSDSQSKATDSKLCAGSILITTPSEKSMTREINFKEYAPVVETDNSLRITKLTNINTVNVQTGYEEHSSKRTTEKSIPKIMFSKTINAIPKTQNQVKRVNKIGKVFLNFLFLGMFH